MSHTGFHRAAVVTLAIFGPLDRYATEEDPLPPPLHQTTRNHELQPGGDRIEQEAIDGTIAVAGNEQEWSPGR